jgi:hypothetical protein
VKGSHNRRYEGDLAVGTWYYAAAVLSNLLLSPISTSQHQHRHIGMWQQQQQQQVSISQGSPCRCRALLLTRMRP